MNWNDNLLAVGEKGKSANGAGNFNPKRKLWTRAARRLREVRAFDLRIELRILCPNWNLPSFGLFSPEVGAELLDVSFSEVFC